jgi:hypothetical protein
MTARAEVRPPGRPWVARLLGQGRVWVWLPYQEGNRSWLKESLGRRIRPEWNKEARRWEIARNHFRPLVVALAEKFGAVDVYLEFSTTERCGTRCHEAVGDDCTCSCLGLNHAGAAYMGDWLQVGETTLARPGVKRVRLLVRRENVQRKRSA